MPDGSYWHGDPGEEWHWETLPNGQKVRVRGPRMEHKSSCGSNGGAEGVMFREKEEGGEWHWEYGANNEMVRIPGEGPTFSELKFLGPPPFGIRSPSMATSTRSGGSMYDSARGSTMAAGGRGRANTAYGAQQGTPWAWDGSNVPWRKNPKTGDEYFWEYGPDGRLKRVTKNEFLSRQQQRP